MIIWTMEPQGVAVQGFNLSTERRCEKAEKKGNKGFTYCNAKDVILKMWNQVNTLVVIDEQRKDQRAIELKMAHA
jgi:ribosomal protein L6P/L9E